MFVLVQLVCDRFERAQSFQLDDWRSASPVATWNCLLWTAVVVPSVQQRSAVLDLIDCCQIVLSRQISTDATLAMEQIFGRFQDVKQLVQDGPVRIGGRHYFEWVQQIALQHLHDSLQVNDLRQ